MKLFGRTDSKEKPVVLTPWSMIHFVTGAASLNYTGFWSAELMHLIYELVGSKRVFNLVGFNITKEDSIINSLGDQGAFTAGRFMKKRNVWTGLSVILALVYIQMGIEF